MLIMFMNNNINNDNNINNRKNILKEKTKTNLQTKPHLHPLSPTAIPFPFRLLPEKQLPKSKEHHGVKTQKKR